MAQTVNEIGAFFTKFINLFSTYKIIGDTLDILFLTFIVYSVLKLIRDSRAINFLKGFGVLLVVWLFVKVFNMQTVAYLFDIFWKNLLVISVIIFAPEIRKALDRIGTSKFSNLKIFSFHGFSEDKKIEDLKNAIQVVTKSASYFSDEKIGAIIVFERFTPLGEIINTGIIINSVLSNEMLENVFYPKAPLHDGAVIIRNSKLYAAGCILPLTQNTSIASSYGTRHRASIGVSEMSDCAVVTVSEETGFISFTVNGKMKSGISDGELREYLLDYLLSEKEAKNEK
ncbi:MAG: diadenylate cyclase CdaA [Clostridia bacterium]|nr:diadenylate cyclase CdaA [Clostridia bacterium]